MFILFSVRYVYTYAFIYTQSHTYTHTHSFIHTEATHQFSHSFLGLIVAVTYPRLRWTIYVETFPKLKGLILIQKQNPLYRKLQANKDHFLIFIFKRPILRASRITKIHTVILFLVQFFIEQTLFIKNFKTSWIYLISNGSRKHVQVDISATQ